MAARDQRFPYGEAVELTARCRRITAPNAGPMTGLGTNTYLIGSDKVAVVDPGPAIDSHISAILESVGAHLAAVFVTHTHRDHSPAARVIADATGAELIGNAIDNDGFQDTSFTAARAIADDECYATAEFGLRAIHTPGHVANHVCYLLEDEGLLLTGDHIMGGSTVVIIPPAGNMTHYIQSLERLLSYEISRLAPGHGDLIEDPQAEIEYLIAHRLRREQKVVDALNAIGQGTIEQLLPLVYDDVDPKLHPVAAKSLHAHLLKLSDEGRALDNDAIWVPLAT